MRDLPLKHYPHRNSSSKHVEIDREVDDLLSEALLSDKTVRDLLP